MSRLEENTEMQKQLVKLSDTLKNAMIDKVDSLYFNSRVLCDIMLDISVSLAVIADKLTVVESEPTEDVAPIIYANMLVDEDGNIKCSNCGNSECWGNYCMNCGAKMTEREEEE